MRYPHFTFDKVPAWDQAGIQEFVLRIRDTWSLPGAEDPDTTGAVYIEVRPVFARESFIIVGASPLGPEVPWRRGIVGYRILTGTQPPWEYGIRMAKRNISLKSDTCEAIRVIPADPQSYPTPDLWKESKRRCVFVDEIFVDCTTPRRSLLPCHKSYLEEFQLVPPEGQEFRTVQRTPIEVNIETSGSRAVLSITYLGQRLPPVELLKIDE